LAERVVIASIEIDESGVVKGMASSVAAVSAGEKAIEGVGAASIRTGGFFAILTGRMVSLRVAALAVGRAFGIAGLITGVAFALSALVKETISSTERFKRAKEAVTDWWQSLVHGEDALGQLSRKMADISKAGGFGSVFDLIDQLKRLDEAFTETFEKRAGTMRGGALFHALSLDLDAISRKTNELMAKLEKMGFGHGELIGLTGAIRRPVPSLKEPTDLFKMFGVASIPQLHETIALARKAQALFVEMGKADPLFPLGDALESIGKKLEQIGLSKEQIEALGLSFNKATVGAQNLAEMMEEQAKHITKAQLAFEVINASINTFVSALTAWAEGGALTMRKFFAQMLIGIGQTLLAWGALALVTAYFGYGPGAAAGLTAIAAGVAALAAARAIGGGAQGVNASSRTSAAKGGAVAGGGNSQTINVTVEGNATEDTVDAIIDAISTRLKDGVSGGNFNGQLARA